MPQFYNSYCSYICFYSWGGDTIFQYNQNLLKKKKKKKKTIESSYQLATIASTSYVALAFVNTTVHNIMDINSRLTRIYIYIKNKLE